MNRNQRQSLADVLAAVRDDERLNEAIHRLRPLLDPRPRRMRDIPPRHDQIPIPNIH